MTLPPYVDEFINLIKIQLKYQRPEDYYYIYGDYVAAKLTGCNPYTIYFFVETKVLVQERVAQMGSLVQSCVDSYKMLYPKHVVLSRVLDRYHHVFEFRGTRGELLFHYDFKCGAILSQSPMFDHELLAEDCYGHMLALSPRTLNISRTNKLYDLIQCVQRKELRVNGDVSRLSRALSDKHCRLFAKNAQRKCQSGWRVLRRELVPFQQECAICMEPFCREPLIGAQCQHYFHLHCLSQYFHNDTMRVENMITDQVSYISRPHHQCPVCKTEIKQLKLTYYPKHNEQAKVLHPLHESTENGRKYRLPESQH